MNDSQLTRLVYQKDYAALKQVIAEGVDLNAVDGDGRTPLMHAVLAIDADDAMIRFLLANGADPAIADRSQRWTALHFAARDQKESVVMALLDSNAEVDAKDSFGNTPLWRCAMEAQAKSEVVVQLLHAGADPNSPNLNGVSPRDVMARRGHQHLIRLLVPSKDQ